MAARRAAKALRPDPAFAIDDAAGFRMFPPGTIPEAAETVALAQQLLADAQGESVVEKRKGAGRKRFLVNLLDSAVLHDQHPMVRLALRPELLNAIVSYMGAVPLLRTISVFYSGAQEKEPVSSQLYHCDADDTRQLKIFVLCSEVTSANGPLTILDAQRSQQVRQASGYGYHSRISDDEVHKIVGTGATEVVGPPGTVCLVDTSRCFHFGSRVQPGAAPRLVTMVQFLTPWAFVIPGDYRRGALLPAVSGAGLSPLQRTVLTGNHDYLES